MNKTARNHQIDYIELGSTDLEQTKTFYTAVFGWSFTDYGPDYTSFNDGSLDGGFTTQAVPGGNPLIVIFASDLEAAYERVKVNGGRISKDIFSFPGGRRFHFTDPSGNELAVWSE